MLPAFMWWGKQAATGRHPEIAANITLSRRSVVDVGKFILSHFKSNKHWPELREYLECVFSLADANAPAGSGDKFLPATPSSLEPATWTTVRDRGNLEVLHEI